MGLRPTVSDLATRPIQPDNGYGGYNNYPLSRALYGPAEIVPDTETATQWSPYGTFVAEPYFGGHDPLSQVGEGVMHVAQSDLYDMSPNPWPNNGQYDTPNHFGGFLTLPRESSVHRGFAQPTYVGPVMLFHAPPIFSVQTTPIPAVGV